MSQYRGQEAETDAAATTESYNETSGPPPATPSQPPPNEHHPYPYPPPAAPYDAAGTAAGHDAFGPRQPFPPAGAKMPPRFNPAQPPTPTLNQLLQSNSPMNPHRYQNNYPEQHYNQWPPQKGYGPAQPTGAYRPPQPYGSGPPTTGYDSRTGWPGGPPPPQGSHHGPGSPNQSQAPAPPSQGQQPPSGNPSPQQPPISHSPGPGPGPGQMPPSPQQQPSFSNRPQPPTTPNAHAPDAADLSGGNSNDSCSGPAPGTPNSQGMRPTPSPTGSTGSRSMSPAVGQNIPMPPRPSSGQSDGGGPPPGRISQSPMPPGPGYGPPSGPQQPSYQGQPYPQPHGGYPPRPQGNYPTQGYGAAPGSQPPVTNNIPPQQFSGRPGPPNHMQSPQFPYQHGWQASGQKGGPGPQNPSAPNSQNPNLRPPHYLKHHLQHKMPFGGVAPGSAPPSPGPPQNFHMGPPPSDMGPPSTMGPPTSSPLLPNSHPHEGPMPPPSSTPNSHIQMGSEMVDNGTNHVSGAPAGSVTSIVTTGPDGTPLDEGSQQSTLSNASAASGEDPVCPQTPKSGRKGGDMSHGYGPPQGGNITSPGAAGSMNSMHEEYNEISSPSSWPRTPASPVFNSHVPPQETYRSKKTDSLSKLYEMDDNPDRRAWLDKLLAFMDDRRTPITTCPTISKNPLDLFRLYMYVKDRGGFMEVTKNKTWKDIAGLLGIGASSSAAYTLRKHYTKNLLAYECQFDRGGIDPQPIINQVEASSKKKGNKQASVPSPGSSNSQDSFPPGGGMDGYVGYNGYPPNEYPQRPSSQSAPSPHGGSGGVNHMNSVPPGGPSPADNVSVSNPFDDVAPSPPPRGSPFPGPPYQSGTAPRGPPNQNYSGQQGYQGYPGPGGGQPDQYSPYPNQQGDSSNTSGNQPNNGQPGGQDPYNRYPGQQGGSYGNRPPYGNTQAPGSQSPAPYPQHQDYYRNDQNQQGGGYPGLNKNMPPPSPQPPRRHPDFAKDQPYPPYGQPRQPMYGGWPNNNQYRPQQYGPQPQGQQQWPQGVRNGGQWPPGQNYQGTQPGQNWQPMATQGQGGPNSAIRPQHRPGKPFPNVMPQGQVKGPNNQPMNSSYGHSQLAKREITFPPDSVENVTPVLYRRKRICRTDVGPVDAWKLMMCLRSGLLSESTYALDMLNILLFDDSSVGYFGLNHWPGLLELLLEQFKKNLSDMFEGPYPKENKTEEAEPDLGAITKPIDPTFRTIVLNRTKNFTLVSRKGDQVKHVERAEDLFITANTKEWDVKGDANVATVKAEMSTDPWSTNAEHILPNFQAEFGHIPFHMTLKDRKEEKIEVKKEKCEEAQPVSNTPPPKSTEKKRTRAKTLSDVISRIKKDSEENEKKENALLPMATATPTTGTQKVKTENQEGESLDLNVNLNGECGQRPIADAPVKRRRASDYEDESYTRDEASLYLLTESHDNLGKRCICLSNILRSLTFIPGNELEFARSLGFLALVGKLLLLHHEHPARTQKTRNYDREEDTDFADSCSSLQGEGEWWWDFLTQIRENVLVCLSNIAGQIDISLYEEDVARPVLDGLLHWAICPSATAQDPFTSAGPSSLLSPQRLALEALCKLCVTNSNVDLVIATPPFSRLEKLCAVLTKHLCRSEDQVLREFSINLLHYLAAADSSMARVVALQSPCISLLVAFIEQAEQSALDVANQRGIGALRDNPDSMGTSLDMLRRAAATLVFLSRHPDNKPLMMQQESRLLALVMSQILDQQVALLISKVLFQISRS